MDRFFDKVEVKESGCWEWTGAIRGKSGYGCIKVNGKVANAHRFSFILHNVEIPKGLLVRHICDNRKCVNPDHLILGTYKDNYDDAVKRGRITPPKHEHLKRHPGVGAYGRGCRCEGCRKVVKEKQREYRAFKKH